MVIVKCLNYCNFFWYIKAINKHQTVKLVFPCVFNNVITVGHCNQHTTSGYNLSALIAIASSYQLYGLRLTYLVGEAITQPG